MMNQAARVLVVDDDPDMCAYLVAGLATAGIESKIALDGVQAIECLQSRPPGWFGLILLDVSMPKQNGWELLDSLRQAGDEVPVIFVSGRDSSEEKIRGLRLGADDYVVKPFLFDELLARMEAVQRRRRSLSPILLGELKIDLARRKTERGGKPVDPVAEQLLEDLCVQRFLGGKVMQQAGTGCACRCARPCRLRRRTAPTRLPA